MERLRKGFHQKGKIYQQDVFLWYIQGRLKILDVNDATFFLSYSNMAA